jgi:hypothetical protein
VNPSHYPATFTVVPWHDGIEAVPALGNYCEVYWAPILHPTAYLLGRRLVAIALDTGGPVEARWLAAAVGILGRMVVDGQERTSLSTYGRTIRRLAKFDLLRFVGPSAQVRTCWPRPNKGLLSSLPEDVRDYEPTMWEAEPRTHLSVPAWAADRSRLLSRTPYATRDRPHHKAVPVSIELGGTISHGPPTS